MSNSIWKAALVFVFAFSATALGQWDYLFPPCDRCQNSISCDCDGMGAPLPSIAPSTPPIPVFRPIPTQPLGSSILPYPTPIPPATPSAVNSALAPGVTGSSSPANNPAPPSIPVPLSNPVPAVIENGSSAGQVLTQPPAPVVNANEFFGATPGTFPGAGNSITDPSSLVSPPVDSGPTGNAPSVPSTEAAAIPNPISSQPTAIDAGAENPLFNQFGVRPPRGGLSASPNMVSDFFGGGAIRILFNDTISASFDAVGTIQSGASTDPNTVIVFEQDGSSPPDDFSTIGLGRDTNDDSFIDEFDIAEPTPPSEVLTSPGPEYTFDGGTVRFPDGDFQDGDTQGTAAGTWQTDYSYTRRLIIDAPGGGGMAIRRLKLTENNNPIPRDRLFFDYNYFNEVKEGLGDVNRFLFGAEKTFLNGLASIEFRAPFAGTLSSEQFTDGSGGRAIEFGNINITAKGVLTQTQTWVLSAGVGLTIPTADDTQIFLPNGVQILNIATEAFHLQPFVGLAWAPNQRWFGQLWGHMDFDLNGNSVAGDINGANLAPIGTLHDAHLFYVDGSLGYWIYRDNRSRCITGIAPALELHYTTTTQDEDFVDAGDFELRSPSSRFDTLNLTVASHFQLRNRKSISPAFVFPLRDDDDRRYNYEFALIANWMF